MATVGVVTVVDESLLAPRDVGFDAVVDERSDLPGAREMAGDAPFKLLLLSDLMTADTPFE